MRLIAYFGATDVAMEEAVTMKFDGKSWPVRLQQERTEYKYGFCSVVIVPRLTEATEISQPLVSTQ